MAMSKVVLTSKAQADLANIKSYIIRELGNPKAAVSVVRRITKTTRILNTYPLAGKPLYTIIDIGEDYRYLISGNYLIFYHLEGLEAHVDHILNGRQDYLQKLFSGEFGEEGIEEE